MSPITWKQASLATLHCLTGCAIGEILGMVIGTALGLDKITTIIISVTLAFVFGYMLTMKSVMKSGVALKAAFLVALAADTVSITVMEIIDNGIMYVVPGAMDTHLADPMFWGTLTFALAVAFVVTVPVNRYLMSRGKGHMVVHKYHDHSKHEDHNEHHNMSHSDSYKQNANMVSLSDPIENMTPDQDQLTGSDHQHLSHTNHDLAHRKHS